MNKKITHINPSSRSLLKKSAPHLYSLLHRIYSYCYQDLISINECDYIFHIKILENILDNLITKLRLNKEELFILLSGVILHDIGLKYAQKKPDGEYKKIIRNHHLYSEKYIIRNYKKMGLTRAEAEIIGNLCVGHRTNNNYFQKDARLNGKIIRFKLLLLLLRFADRLDLKSQQPLPGIKTNFIERNFHKSIKKIYLKSNPLKVIVIFETNKNLATKIGTAYLMKKIKLIVNENWIPLKQFL